VSRPHFLPPKPRLIDLTTPTGIKRAIPAFASAVTRGTLEPSDAYGTLMLAWLRVCATPPSAATIRRAEARLDAALLDAYRVCEAIDLHEAQAAAIQDMEEAA
jgi:hypothetical protein